MKTICAVIITTLIIAAISSLGLSNIPESDPEKYNESRAEEIIKEEIYGPYRVDRVVNGNTIVLDINHNKEAVKLIGVDISKNVSPDKGKDSMLAKTAWNYLESLLKNKSVYLEYDEKIYDKDERMLAYVYLEDTMVNHLLIANGYAAAEKIEPNVKYADLFISLENEAKNKEIGFWDTSYNNN